MKVLCVLVLVAMGHGLPLETSVAQLSAPTSIKVTVLDAPAFEVSWEKVDSVDERDPVIGYKVKIWEIKNIKTTKYMIENGEVKRVEEDNIQQMDLISYPGGMPTELLTPADQTSAIYRNVKLDVTYEIRVAAITKTQEGPSSTPIRIKLNE